MKHVKWINNHTYLIPCSASILEKVITYARDRKTERGGEREIERERERRQEREGERESKGKEKTCSNELELVLMWRQDADESSACMHVSDMWRQGNGKNCCLQGSVLRFIADKSVDADVDVVCCCCESIIDVVHSWVEKINKRKKNESKYEILNQFSILHKFQFPSTSRCAPATAE